MAKLGPVMPTIVGRTQPAQRDVRPVVAPNAFGGIGESIGSAINGGLRIASVAADVLYERDEADFRRALSEAVSEADQRMHSEVLSQEGFAAQGAAERAIGIYEEVGGKVQGALSGRNIRRFQEMWGARRNAQMNSVASFERGQLQRAQLDADASLLKNQVSNYVATLEPASLNAAKEAFDDTVRIRNGGRLISRESLARFDADIADGNDRIQLPDGRTIRIADDAKPGEKEVISRERLTALRETMAKQAEVYETGLQNLYDAAHAQVVERYLRDDRVGAAAEYLGAIGAEGYPQGVSRGALTEFNEAVARKREAVDVSEKSSFAISKVLAAAGPESQRYGSTEQDYNFNEMRRKVLESHTGEKHGTGRKIIADMESRYRMLQEQQQANFSHDMVQMLTQMQKSGDTLPAKAKMIAEMKDSPLKAALLKAHERECAVAEQEQKQREQEFDSRDDAAFLLDQEDKLNNFRLALAAGGAKLDDHFYQFSDREALKSYLLNLGLTAKNRKRAGEYAVNSAHGVDATMAATELARLLNIGDPAAALARYPMLLSELDARKGTSVIEPVKMNAWLRQNVTEILTQMVSLDKNWLPDSSNTLKKYLEDGRSPDKLYYDKEQLTAVWRSDRARRALRANDTAGAAAALQAVPQGNDLENFAKTRGYDYRNGLAYLKGGN